MKANQLTLLFLFLILGVAVAQQTNFMSSATNNETIADLRAKAEGGDAQAQNLLACAFYFGDLGLAKDPVEAVKWFRKAAEQNDASAQFNLGVCYKQGHGVAIDFVEAVKWYRKAADQNNDNAQSNLGYCYVFGQGVETNYAEAARLFRKAADQNNASAQFNLGNSYFRGEGVMKDEIEAVKWFAGVQKDK